MIKITPRTHNKKFLRVQQINEEPSKTKQSFAEETDINYIMRKYEKTGLLPQYHGAVFGDFDNVEDYQSAMNRTIEAQAAFESLPARIRDRFSNDPARFLDFATNPENTEEMYSLGMLKRPAPAAPGASSDRSKAAEAKTPEPKPQSKDKEI